MGRQPTHLALAADLAGAVRCLAARPEDAKKLGRGIGARHGARENLVGPLRSLLEQDREIRLGVRRPAEAERELPARRKPSTSTFAAMKAE